MCATPVFPGIDQCIASLRGGNGKAVLALLNAIKARMSAEMTTAETQCQGLTRTLGVDYCRALCFLSADWWHAGDAQYGPFHARQAVLEELRWHPNHLPSRELLFELNAAIRPRLLPPAEVKREEPFFYDLVDALLDHTMLSWPRLLQLFQSVRATCRGRSSEQGGGHVVECGCAGGGASVMMAVALRQFSPDGTDKASRRCVFALDTFVGMPQPTATDGVASSRADSPKQSWGTGTCSAPAWAVTDLARSFGVEERLCTIQGDFRETLPQVLLKDARVAAEGVSVLHIDADWFESVKSVLDHMLPVMALSPQDGASKCPRVVQIDDYHYWDGARKAVDEALLNWSSLVASHETATKGHAAAPALHEIDGNAVYFQL